MKKEEIVEKLIERSSTSRIVAWEVENFAQYEKARFEFDDSGIIMLKGFNSAGKSNALRALRLALTTEKMSTGKLRRYIRHGCLDASVTIFMSDGSEIKYILSLSSHNKRAKFVNGYHWYLNHKGKKYELFSTKVDGKYIPQRVTPSVLERYFNLTVVDKGYFNILKKADGMLLTEQTPKAINKALARATQMETAERAVKRIQDNNKKLLDGMKTEELKVQMYSEQIENSSVVTKGVIDKLRLVDENIARSETTLDKFNGITDKLGVISNIDKRVMLESIDTSKMKLLLEVQVAFKRLSNVSDSVVLGEIPKDKLSVYSNIINKLEILNKIDDGIEVAKIENQKIDLLRRLSNVLEKYQLQTSIEIPILEKANTVALETYVELANNLNQYVTLSSKEQEIEQVQSKNKEGAALILEELKELGHPVFRCSSCRTLTIAEEFNLDEGGGCGHVNN